MFLGRFTFHSTTGAPTGTLSLGPNGVVVHIFDSGNPAEPPPGGGPQNRYVWFTAFDQPVWEGFDEVLAGPFALSQPYILTLHQHTATLPPDEYLICNLYVVASVPPFNCPGDANDDGLVNGADLSVLLFQFGATVAPGVGADFNDDGVVNGADLSILLANFGESCG